MATMIASAAILAPRYGLGSFAPLSVGRRSLRLGGGGARRGCAAATKASFSPESHSSTTRPLPSVNSFQDVHNLLFNGAQSWTERISDTGLGKGVASIVASTGYYLQASAAAVEEVVKMEEQPKDYTVVLVTSAVIAVIYLFIVPAVIYNYLRLRWYKRNAVETFFQFLLVFIFFPGMLLLAPFINFRRMPREGTEPP